MEEVIWGYSPSSATQNPKPEIFSSALGGRMFATPGRALCAGDPTPDSLTEGGCHHSVSQIRKQKDLARFGSQMFCFSNNESV